MSRCSKTMFKNVGHVCPASPSDAGQTNVQGSLRIQLYRIVQEVIRYKTLVGIYVFERVKNSVQLASGKWFTTTSVQGSLWIQLYLIIQEVMRYKTLVGIWSLNVFKNSGQPASGKWYRTNHVQGSLQL